MYTKRCSDRNMGCGTYDRNYDRRTWGLKESFSSDKRFLIYGGRIEISLLWETEKKKCKKLFDRLFTCLLIISDVAATGNAVDPLRWATRRDRFRRLGQVLLCGLLREPTRVPNQFVFVLIRQCIAVIWEAWRNWSLGIHTNLNAKI